jgi:UDP-3-O-[3-hydroxymyristoyl] glucosamine N-acyltransferase
VGADCSIGRDVSFRAGAIVGDRCRIGDRVDLGPGTVVGDGVAIGDDTVLHANVTVYHDCRIGARVIIHGGTVIGSDGFGFAVEEGVYHKIPQLGNVVIEDDVEIGANVTIDRATFGSTVVGRGSKLDNLIQVGHNCQIGEHCALVAQVGLSGSVRLGRGVAVGGQAGVVGHLVIGDHARIGARAVVTGEVAPGAYVMGHPAVDHRLWKRAQAAWTRLPQILRRLRRLEGRPRRARKEE